jgi:hypothetical protein
VQSDKLKRPLFSHPNRNAVAFLTLGASLGRLKPAKGHWYGHVPLPPCVCVWDDCHFAMFTRKQCRVRSNHSSHSVLKLESSALVLAKCGRSTQSYTFLCLACAIDAASLAVDGGTTRAVVNGVPLVALCENPSSLLVAAHAMHVRLVCALQ